MVLKDFANSENNLFVQGEYQSLYCYDENGGYYIISPLCLDGFFDWTKGSYEVIPALQQPSTIDCTPSALAMAVCRFDEIFTGIGVRVQQMYVQNIIHQFGLIDAKDNFERSSSLDLPGFLVKIIRGVDGISGSVIGVRSVKIPTVIPNELLPTIEKAREHEDVIIDDDNAYFPRGHALFVLQGVFSRDTKEQFFICFDPLFARIYGVSLSELNDTMYKGDGSKQLAIVSKRLQAHQASSHTS